MKNQAAVDAADTLDHEINARLHDRLPTILEAICSSKFSIEPHLKEASIAVGEFLDYLDFEIEKVTLNIEKFTWASIVDVNAVTIEKAWLAKLKQLRSEFDAKGVVSSQVYLDSLTVQIRETFKC